MPTPPLPPVHRDLDFNAPLSPERADRLIRTLGPLGGRRVLDLGCGWGELLLRTLAADPGATGVGVDLDADAIAHGRANAAARGLAERAELIAGDAGQWSGAPVDLAINIGATHIWGGEPETHTATALTALSGLLRPGGRLLFGECFWARTPTATELALAQTPLGQYGSLADLADVAIAHGFRLLALSEATLSEWDDFESRYAIGREEWLAENPGSPDHADVLARADAHRTARLRSWRETLGFGYLTLLRV